MINPLDFMKERAREQLEYVEFLETVLGHRTTLLLQNDLSNVDLDNLHMQVPDFEQFDSIAKKIREEISARSNNRITSGCGSRINDETIDFFITVSFEGDRCRRYMQIFSPAIENHRFSQMVAKSYFQQMNLNTLVNEGTP